MAADEKALGELHNKVAEVLTIALDGDELPGYVDEETGEEVPAKKLPPSAAILAVAAKFLKDNQITCVPSKDNALGELEEKLRNRNAAKTSKVDFAAASEQMGFLNGLPN